MYLFAIIIIIFIIWWIIKVQTDTANDKRAAIEFEKPENQFKRRKKDYIEVLKEFHNRSHYPYVILPSYNVRLKAEEPLLFDPLFTDEKIPVEIKLAKEGKTEKFFFERLIKRFGKHHIKLGNVSVSGYYPDIAYIDVENNIYIDIEVDEPYSLKTKLPIHHLKWETASDKKPNRLDTNEKRDEAFKTKGWTVVRFSEDQVIQNAKECIDIIHLIVNYWSDTYSGPRQVEYQSLFQKRWIFEDAADLAMNSYRETTIDNKLVAYIKKESDLKYDSDYELPYKYYS